MDSAIQHLKKPRPELGFGPLEFKLKGVRQHLTKYVGGNNRDKDRKNTSSLFKRRFSLPSRR